jgi:hypothetical protein
MKGIFTAEQYEALGPERRHSGSRVAFTLLRMSENPSEREIQRFEDINFTLRTSNGVFRTTFRKRFEDVDAAVNEWLSDRFPSHAPLRAEDRGASNGLTSYEWATALRQHFPEARVLSTDLLHHFFEVDLGKDGVFIAEPDGAPIQYIHPPYVVGLAHMPSWKNPFSRLEAMRARRLSRELGLTGGLRGEWWKGRPFQTRELSCVHPVAARYAELTGALRFEVKSVFDAAAEPCHAVRTMNILNLSYFTGEQLKQGIEAAHASLVEGGIWIVGRTMESSFANNVSILARKGSGWKLLARMGSGSEIEPLT